MTNTLQKSVIKRDAWGDVVAVYDTYDDAAKAEGVSKWTVKMWVQKSKVAPVRGHIWQAEQPHEGTLCWSCDKAVCGCSWSREFKPVEGWTAVRRDVRVWDRVRKVTTESYFVKDCPGYVPDKRK